MELVLIKLQHSSQNVNNFDERLLNSVWNQRTLISGTLLPESLNNYPCSDSSVSSHCHNSQLPVDVRGHIYCDGGEKNIHVFAYALMRAMLIRCTCRLLVQVLG